MNIRVLVNGAQGKMGQITLQTLLQNADIAYVAASGRNDSLGTKILEEKINVVIDFTNPNVVYDNAKTIIANGAHPVIGTSGLKDEEIADLQNKCKEKKLGGIIAPNFALGMLLILQAAKKIAHYFPQVEIIEMHHDKKKDAPSGTAIRTAETINSARSKEYTVDRERGNVIHDIPIHSVRLPGLLAHQSILFGGVGEIIKLHHDAMSRECFMPGVLFACKKVFELNELIYGLEQLL